MIRRFIFLISVPTILIFVYFFKGGIILNAYLTPDGTILNILVQVPESYSLIDSNANSIADPIDIVNSARKEVEKQKRVL